MDSTVDNKSVSLPGVGETEPTTILEELHRNLANQRTDEPTDTSDNLLTQLPPISGGSDLNENFIDKSCDTIVTSEDQTFDKNDLLTVQLKSITSELDVNEIIQVESNKNDNENSKDSFLVPSSTPIVSTHNSIEEPEILNFELQVPVDNDQDILKRSSTASPVLQPSSQAAYIASLYSNRSGSEGREKSPPPHPPITYKWEDVKRAKAKGGYPWTYLDPHEPKSIPLSEPQPLLRLSCSPKSIRRVDEQQQVDNKDDSDHTLSLTESSQDQVKEIDNISEHCSEHEREEDHDVEEHIEEPPLKTPQEQSKPSSILRGILKRSHLKKLDTTQTIPPDNSIDLPKKIKCCHPFVDKLKTMADKQLHKVHHKKSVVKTIPLGVNDKIVLQEETKIIKLKESPRADRKEIATFKQDSEEIIEILDLDESPSEVRKRRELEQHQLQLEKGNSLENGLSHRSSIIVPDEIIELPFQKDIHGDDDKDSSREPTVAEILEEEMKNDPPPKAPRKKKEHVYEDIENPEFLTGNTDVKPIQDDAILNEMKRQQDIEEMLENIDNSMDIEQTVQPEDSINGIVSFDSRPDESSALKIMAPISTIESDENINQTQLSAVSEQEEQPIDIEGEAEEDREIRSVLKKESSPGIDKKVTFSPSTEHGSDEEELHKEDVILPEHIKVNNRWSTMTDHEYEPIGEPPEENIQKITSREPSTDIAAPPAVLVSKSEAMELPSEPMEINEDQLTENILDTAPKVTTDRKFIRADAEIEIDPDLSEFDIQHQIEDRYFTPSPTTVTDEIHTSQVDSSAIEDLPLRREDRKKSIMETANDRTKQMHLKLKTQAGKLRTRFKSNKPVKIKPDSPKLQKERKVFKAPEFTKFKNLQMPKINKPDFKRPNFSKLKPDIKASDFKISLPNRPKFTKPDMSRFKMSDKFSSLRLNRSKSLKESVKDSATDGTDFGTVMTETGTSGTDTSAPTLGRKLFDFGTYPRIFDRKKKQKDDESETSFPQTQVEFATVSRTAVLKSSAQSSFTDNDSGRYQRYSAEPDGFERETSLERRMRVALENADQDEEFDDRGILQTEEQKQLADYDEENREIHKISQARENEFKRRPFIHQDSDLVSEESNKDLGWIESEEIRKHILAHSDDLNANQKFEYINETLPERDSLSVEPPAQPYDSPSNRRKGVIEEIDDDEFFLRKKGISQDDIQIGQYITSAIREDLPVNALARIDRYSAYRDDQSQERMNYNYDVPPPKPRRVKDFEKSLESTEFTEEFMTDERYDTHPRYSLDYGRKNDTYYKSLPPNKPLRKIQQQYSDEIQDEDIPVAAEYYSHTEEEIDGTDMYLKSIDGYKPTNGYSIDNKENIPTFDNIFNSLQPPKAPKRRKKLRDSLDRDSVGQMTGRSISNNFISNDAVDNVVYRTQHEYIIPIAQQEEFLSPVPIPRRVRSQSQITDDDRTSHGAESLMSDTHPMVDNFVIDIKESSGYAVIKKEPPPRPPAPIRRKRSTKSLDDRQVSTMPRLRKEMPDKSHRNFNTIGPTRPPRRVSSTSIGENNGTPSPDATQYEEIDEFENDLRNLNSGKVVSKMKDRPLPPPPRPPRDRKPLRDRKGLDDDPNNDYKFDKGGSGVKLLNIDDFSRISSQEVEEVEVSTQTDPLPDDYVCEEFEITEDMKIIEPSNRHSKTLQDILKEEQHAEMERAKQMADVEYLTKSLQKFRDANQRSISERSKGSTTDRPKTPSSRPITPSAIVIEQRLVLPTTQTDATLIVQPVSEDSPMEMSREESKDEEDIPYMEDATTEDERIVSEALKRYRLLDDSFESLTSPTVPPKPNILSEPALDIREEEIFEEEPPLPPPRRKSSAAETTIQQATENVLIPTQVPDPPIERMQIAELAVENLNVNALQAGRILVSDLQGISITAQDLECRSGNLVVRGIELPAGFIEDLVARVRLSEREEQSQPLIDEQSVVVEPIAKTIEETKTEPLETVPPVRPPPPQSFNPSDYTNIPFSIPPTSFYQLRDQSDGEQTPFAPPGHSPTHHRRRRHRRRDESSSEDEQYRESRRSRHGTQSPEPGVIELSGQLIRACGTAVSNAGSSLLNMIRTSKKEENKRDLHIILVILIVIIAALMLLGIGGERAVHHHHWDYFNPPENAARQ